ncbi:urea ABC transporter permease subunit UrtC [Candidatus Poribacteria bacterium]|nr:urea ABC transporter permease subunit UrtC [Candidatus Poribacteria bacterium]
MIPIRNPQSAIRNRGIIAFGVIGFILLVVLPLLNILPSEGAWYHISNYRLNLFGKFLCYAIVALGIDLIWGYTGILSLGHGMYFALGGYCMGMYLMLVIGKQGVYGSELPDFMVFLNWTKLPWYWPPFRHAWFMPIAVILVPGLSAMVFGFLTFRSRIRGVYFAIITQALTYALALLFFRNNIGLGGNNGLTDFKRILGFPLDQQNTMCGLYIITVLCLGGAYLLCRWITASKLGRVLIAIRDNENRVRFSGYSPARFKLFAFAVSAILAGIAGALYVPQVGIINPSELEIGPSLEMVIWVAVGGRGTLVGAALGSFVVNWSKSLLTGSTIFSQVWPYLLGGLFLGVVMFIPEGLVGLPRRLSGLFRRLRVAHEKKSKWAAGEQIGESTIDHCK